MNKKTITHIIDEINFMANQIHEIKIMEVCGTHTQMIAKSGIKSILPPNIKLLSGPGCPVCVSEESYIDNAIEIFKNGNEIIATFGDMLRVSGTNGSLLDEKAKGSDVRIIYSPLELIDMAEQIKNKRIVFLAVGFETTAPVIALTIKKAHERKIDNLFFLTSLKLMPPILHYIMGQTINNIDGFICPGHVASVTGSEYFRFISQDYYLPAAVCGFEAEDILTGIHYLVKQISQSEKKELFNLYISCVKSEGNLVAKRLMKEVFKTSDGEWRGIGKVKDSSLIINEKYSKYDALNAFKLEKNLPKANTNCQCKDILLGYKTPNECILFGRICNPLKPYGSCMVSSEGACSIFYRYKEKL
ncbi:MAG: hydrogenase formation protein HypD [Tissierellia bacterium]|nr:hydrogenase formation protein HypD [Tissierellia bacterium]